LGEVSLKMRRFLLKDFLFKPFGDTFVDSKIGFWMLQLLIPQVTLLRRLILRKILQNREIFGVL
jgi:hypothetical protein